MPEPTNIIDALQSAKDDEDVVTSDTVELATNRGVWVGGAGDITGMLRRATVAKVYAAIPAGTFLPFDFKLIKTASTATLMVVVR